MEISVIQSLIGEYTFPIVAFLLMYRVCTVNQKQLIEAVTELTIAIKSIESRLDIIEKLTVNKEDNDGLE